MRRRRGERARRRRNSRHRRASRSAALDRALDGAGARRVRSRRTRRLTRMLAQQSIARIGALGTLLALASPAPAEDFYKGKTISLIESGLTGAYDAYARAMARCLPRHIPGNPAVVVQGKPGAAGVVAANYLYNIAPRDGTVIATVHGSVLVAPLLSPSQVRFDLSKFGWIGNVTHDTYVGYVMS